MAYLNAQEVTTDGIDVTADWTVPLDVSHFARVRILETKTHLRSLMGLTLATTPNIMIHDGKFGTDVSSLRFRIRVIENEPLRESRLFFRLLQSYKVKHEYAGTEGLLIFLFTLTLW